MTLTDFITRATVAASFAACLAACSGSGSGASAGDGDSAAGGAGPAAAAQEAANNAPAISGAPSPTAREGTFYEFTPTAFDLDGDPIVFGIVGKPDWAEFDTGNGRLSGTPGSEDVGRYPGIVISASDGKAESPLPAMAIDVLPQHVNTAPSISGSASGSIIVGESYAFLPAASDADDDPLSFIIVNPPAWAVFDPASGKLSGTPSADDIGDYPDIRISVSDGEETVALDPFLIVVNPPPVINLAPAISGQPPASVMAGAFYSFAPTAWDPDGDALAFSIAGKPPWLLFDFETGSLTGTPSESDVGVHAGISIAASDGEDEAILGPFAIEVVAPNSPPEISGLPTLKVVKGEPYRFVPDASDADGDVLTFGIVGQPAWATFSTTTGELAGSPAASDAGLYENIVITVTDGEDDDSLGPFAIRVLTVGPRAAELTWTPPTENNDGTALTDLAGYVVYWGMVTGNYSNSVTLENPGLTSYVVENLAPGRSYYFVVTAVNGTGLESDHSNEASKSIPDDE